MIKKKLTDKIFSGTHKKEGGESLPEKPKHSGKNVKLYFVVFIVDWDNVNIVSDVFIEEKVRFHFACKAMGTASSDILDILGIGSSDKAVVFCLEQEIGVPVLLKEVRKKLKNKGPGAGIAFTISLSAINDPILVIFKQSIMKNRKITPPKGDNMKTSNDLIMCVVNHGNSDEVMTTARAAGATGGTVINARGTAHAGAVKFFGVSVQDEKEMILILTSHDKKTAIMQAICETHGLNTEAQGIVFSLPVDNVMGLSFD